MSKEKSIYALATNDVEQEMVAIRKAWDALSRLDTHGRQRAVQWLSNWVRAEAGPDNEMGMF